MYAFDFERPTTLQEAVTALAADDEAQALAGGQTLIPTLKQRLAAPSTLVSLTAIPELQGLCRADDGALCIGAATSHAAVAAGAGAGPGAGPGAEVFPALAQLAGQIGDPAVRNRGTIGGSLANNDPSACYPAAALACGATIVTNTREIPADGFFDGMFGTALEEGELIVEIRFPVPTKAAYAKFEQPASRFALVGVFVAQFDDGVRVAVTGASEDGVFRWSQAEAALTKEFSSQALTGLTLDPEGLIADLHATAPYRAHLVGVMARRAVDAAQPPQRQKE